MTTTDPDPRWPGRGPMMTDHAELRRLAESVELWAPTPWEAQHGTPAMQGPYWYLRSRGRPGIRLSAQQYGHEIDVAAYFAAVSPDVVVALLNDLGAAEELLEDVEATASDQRIRLTGRLQVAEATLSRLAAVIGAEEARPRTDTPAAPDRTRAEAWEDGRDALLRELVDALNPDPGPHEEAPAQAPFPSRNPALAPGDAEQYQCPSCTHELDWHGLPLGDGDPWCGITGCRCRRHPSEIARALINATDRVADTELESARAAVRMTRVLP